ncbi:TetR family transcriptional regulator [Pseudoroseomonas wenyumeiae]|uniref:TetR family transcriptional regulator n=1 Tax=Teichococcus wenyumeiae TaxID=2478470 RepID=A0A3A9JHC8_9PROT|nr:TetR/AcrR family transcriptional regulator [Pseudoroseomonas wenyumeiae]RKK03026.1 TetR/AcrR family transcriptional regulator [Pseudoroseomonas wenyumeiae]RMI15520.1 TetR family transcriptional regulator [Pseudoroseomonas wenyumeiae]
MDNPTRSRRSRAAALEAALIIIERDGSGRLTLDAMARECGISKGGIMHQFRTKDAVLRALLELQRTYFSDFTRDYLLEVGEDTQDALLHAEIATAREAITMQRSVAFALLGAVAEDHSLLDVERSNAAAKITKIRSTSKDPDAATIKWLAAKGMAFSNLLGICPFTPEEREHVFDLLLQPAELAEENKPAQPAVEGKPPRPAQRRKRSKSC